KVYLRTPFRKMYLPAAAGDAGGAIGAACVVAAKLEIRKSEGVDLEREKPAEISTLAFRPSPLFSAYLGPHFSNDEIEHLLEDRGLLPNSPVGQALLPAEPINGKRARLPYRSEHPGSPLRI